MEGRKDGWEETQASLDLRQFHSVHLADIKRENKHVKKLLITNVASKYSKVHKNNLLKHTFFWRRSVQNSPRYYLLTIAKMDII